MAIINSNKKLISDTIDNLKIKSQFDLLTLDLLEATRGEEPTRDVIKAVTRYVKAFEKTRTKT